jgi:hypothetical protein
MGITSIQSAKVGTDWYVRMVVDGREITVSFPEDATATRVADTFRTTMEMLKMPKSVQIKNV